jgi:hypothetical protein
VTKVRDLLELLGRDSLTRLAEMRGLAPSHDNDERRARIARSYRGELDAFLGDLRRIDLLELMQQDWWIGERCYHLPRAASRSQDELLRIAKVVFHDRVSLEVREVEGEDIEEEQEHAQARSEAAQRAWETRREREGDDGGPMAPDEAGAPRDPLALLRLGPEWSRSRKLSRVLMVLGMEPPERLRTVRFQEAMRALAEIRVAVELDDGTALGPSDSSPGISARVRLRRLAPGEKWPPTSTPSENDPPPAVTIVPGSASQSRPPAPVSDWELALARLHFLTCVHDVDRRFRPDWPDAFVAAAARDLELGADHRRMLPLVAASVSYGTHDPLRVIAQLAPRLGRDSWIALLADFRRLNASQAELAEEIARAAQRAAGLDARDTRLTLVPDTEPEPASGQPMATSSEPAEARSMGALDGIFDD